MYDSQRAQVRAWWVGLATAMRAEGLSSVPEAPDWPDDLHQHWREPQLLLSQTCGYPLVTRLREEVQVVGAFRYAVPGCVGIHYRSSLVVRKADAGRRIEDYRGRSTAFNDRASHSGYNALRALVAPLARGGRFFAGAIESGSHRHSLDLVRGGRADIAAIDCISLAGFERADAAALAGLRVIGHTAAAPGLPLITGASTTADELAALRRALAAACADPALAEARAALFIEGFEPLDASVWQRVEGMRRAAEACGCTEL